MSNRRLRWQTATCSSPHGSSVWSINIGLWVILMVVADLMHPPAFVIARVERCAPAAELERCAEGRERSNVALRRHCRSVSGHSTGGRRRPPWLLLKSQHILCVCPVWLQQPNRYGWVGGCGLDLSRSPRNGIPPWCYEGRFEFDMVSSTTWRPQE
mgnify:CR=1 FL=1